LPGSAPSSEAELLQLLSRDDPEAFAVLFRRHGYRVYELARTMLKSEHLAEDLVQEVFLRVWKNRALLAAVRSFDAYLFIAARNEVLHTLRNDDFRAELLRRYGRSAADAEGGLEREIQQKDLLRLLDKAVNGLPPQQRVAFRLAHQSGLGISDIGIAMGISRNTVRNHLARALQALRSHLRRPSEP